LLRFSQHHTNTDAKHLNFSKTSNPPFHLEKNLVIIHRFFITKNLLIGKHHGGEIIFPGDDGVLPGHDEWLCDAKQMPVVGYIIAQTAGGACSKCVT